MLTLGLALLMGTISGLRAMIAPAALSWAAYLGALDLGGTWFAFLAFRFTPWIFTVLALTELVTDKLASTPSRKVPLQFGARVSFGGLSGAAIGSADEMLVGGLLSGIVGAVAGTLAGASLRTRLAHAFDRDVPAALLEDAAAVVGAWLIMAAIR